MAREGPHLVVLRLVGFGCALAPVPGRRSVQGVSGNPPGVIALEEKARVILVVVEVEVQGQTIHLIARKIRIDAIRPIHSILHLCGEVEHVPGPCGHDIEAEVLGPVDHPMVQGAVRLFDIHVDGIGLRPVRQVAVNGQRCIQAGTHQHPFATRIGRVLRHILLGPGNGAQSEADDCAPRHSSHGLSHRSSPDPYGLCWRRVSQPRQDSECRAPVRVTHPGYGHAPDVVGGVTPPGTGFLAARLVALADCGRNTEFCVKFPILPPWRPCDKHF